MVIAISGFGIGYRSLEHRLVSHSGTRTVDDKAGETRKTRKGKERTCTVSKAEEAALTRVRIDDTPPIQKRESFIPTARIIRQNIKYTTYGGYTVLIGPISNQLMCSYKKDIPVTIA